MAALSEVTHAYRLNRDNISVFELRQEARSWQENFTWTSWMLHNTRVENLAFSSNSATFGQAAQRQQMPRQTEADRQKLSALLCTDLLLPLCELFNLEPEVAMELLDSYFCEQPKDYHFLYSLEQGLLQREHEMHACQTRQAQLAQQMQMQPRQAPLGAGAWAQP